MAPFTSSILLELRGLIRYTFKGMVSDDEIKNEILKALPDALVLIHSLGEDRRHFEATVISNSFEGKSLIEQQRVVMLALEELFNTSLHAMSLKTYTPTGWKQVHHGKTN